MNTRTSRKTNEGWLVRAEIPRGEKPLRGAYNSRFRAKFTIVCIIPSACLLESGMVLISSHVVPTSRRLRWNGNCNGCARRFPLYRIAEPDCPDNQPKWKQCHESSFYHGGRPAGITMEVKIINDSLKPVTIRCYELQLPLE